MQTQGLQLNTHLGEPCRFWPYDVLRVPKAFSAAWEKANMDAQRGKLKLIRQKERLKDVTRN